jgi:hypothetical protein
LEGIDLIIAPLLLKTAKDGIDGKFCKDLFGDKSKRPIIDCFLSFM